jgi:hypothetical protein
MQLPLLQSVHAASHSGEDAAVLQAWLDADALAHAVITSHVSPLT